MKTSIKKIALGLMACLLLNSCATILGGQISPAQRTRPLMGQPQRQVQVGYLIADIICGLIPVVIDFGTCAIYKPRSPSANALIKVQKK